ncbi:RxLR effector protein [Phytophthora megakarya]|uniref:RxLR effector protein n=1 Tax=Phytophthora megakarya TaxID=4795 RepID=A0A225VM37_9STRA|nr:RxLR effector protein [Phytophthora megakarya]
MALLRTMSCSIYITALTMILFLVCSVSAHLEQVNAMTEILRSPDAGETAASTIRSLRGGGFDGDIVNEDRGIITDKLVNIPMLKLDLTLSLELKYSPAQVLTGYRKLGIPMRENYLVLWMSYVQKYRTKMGIIEATDEYVVKTLTEFIPRSQLPVVFTAMKKNAKLLELAKNLQNVVDNAV